MNQTPNNNQNREDWRNARFQTILVGRPNTAAPTEVEVLLREYCDRIKITDKILPHFLVRKAEASLAVRVYYEHDMDRLEQAFPSPDDLLAQVEKGEYPDIDNLHKFMSMFATALVLFVLPPGSRQLDSNASFANRALSCIQFCESQTNFVRAMVVADAEQALEAILCFTRAIAPDLKQKRTQYIRQQMKQNFTPTELRIDPSLNIHASAHVQKALREWGEQNDLFAPDIDILLDNLGQLGNITELARPENLANLAIEDETKEKFGALFGFRVEPASVDQGPEETLSEFDDATKIHANDFEDEEMQLEEQVVDEFEEPADVEVVGPPFASSRVNFSLPPLQPSPYALPLPPSRPFQSSTLSGPASVPDQHRYQRPSHEAYEALYRGIPWGHRVCRDFGSSSSTYRSGMYHRK